MAARVESFAGPLRAAYLRPATTKSWSPRQLDEWVRQVAASSLNAIAVKAPYITPELRQACEASGLSLVASVTCFSDHDRQPVDERLWPVDEHGQPFPKHGWYRGVIPTDPGFNGELLDRVSVAAGIDGVSGVILDFMRWPVHWETELRRGATVPPRGSFDPVTLARFRSWLESRGLANANVIIEDAPTSAEAIDASLQHEWRDFRCDVITDLVSQCAERIHAARLWAGVFTVPLTRRDRVEIVGQDTAALGAIVDALFPMTYHGIMYYPWGWVTAMAADVRATSTVPLVPAVQLTADAEFSAGNDWGPSIDVNECVSVAAELDERFDGFFVFPGEALDERRRTHLATSLPPLRG